MMARRKREDRRSRNPDDLERLRHRQKADEMRGSKGDGCRDEEDARERKIRVERKRREKKIKRGRRKKEDSTRIFVTQGASVDPRAVGT
jgi:hypothetical protein